MPELWHCFVYLSLVRIRMRFPDAGTSMLGNTSFIDKKNLELASKDNQKLRNELTTVADQVTFPTRPITSINMYENSIRGLLRKTKPITSPISPLNSVRVTSNSTHS